jgi:hypothetical protein
MNSGDGPDAHREGVSEVKEAAKQGAQVASSAADSAKQVAGEAATQAKAVAQQAREHVSTLLDQTRDEVRETARQKGQQAAVSLHTVADQLRMLANGQPDQAGQLQRYVEDAQDRVTALANRLETEGPEGILDDVTRFARRRPGLFLVAAAGAGFAIGRLVRAGAASAGEQSQTQAISPSAFGGYPLSGADSEVMTSELPAPVADTAVVAPTLSPTATASMPLDAGLSDQG